MAKQLRHRSTKARGARTGGAPHQELLDGRLPLDYVRMVSPREFVPHHSEHRDEGVSATCSALCASYRTACCLSAAWHAPRTPRTPHAALALLLLVPRTHRATKPLHTTHERRRTTTKRCYVPTRAQSRRRRSMGHVKTWWSPRQRGPVARAGRFPLPPMRAWLEQPHGRRHKAPHQPSALTTSSLKRPCRCAASSRAAQRRLSRDLDPSGRRQVGRLEPAAGVSTASCAGCFRDPRNFPNVFSSSKCRGPSSGNGLPPQIHVMSHHWRGDRVPF